VERLRVLTQQVVTAITDAGRRLLDDLRAMGRDLSRVFARSDSERERDPANSVNKSPLEAESPPPARWERAIYALDLSLGVQP